jgi:hypothetical protein
MLRKIEQRVGPGSEPEPELEITVEGGLVKILKIIKPTSFTPFELIQMMSTCGIYVDEISIDIDLRTPLDEISFYKPGIYSVRHTAGPDHKNLLFISSYQPLQKIPEGK